jgi:NAD(P)-dependent dehydrogenase (short-subunit alcohol dehydrogenase family)
MKELKDRVAVVTGGSSGIGYATAERLAAEGMRIVLADVEEASLHWACESLKARGADAVSVVTDVSRDEHVDALADAAFRHFGAVHVVFNNAGVATFGALHESPLAELQRVVGINLWGVIHGIRSFVPRMLEQGLEGHVLSTASTAGLTTPPYQDIYSVSKFGVVAAMECLHKEFLLTGARLHASVVIPGLIKTGIVDSALRRPVDPTLARSQGAVEREALLKSGIEAGYPPSVVADAVVDGIRSENFWILAAQPIAKARIDQRLDEVRDLRNPAPPDVQ